MAMVKPLLDSITTFDATTEKTITFVSVGGSQVVANQIVITNNSTNTVVYTNKVISFEFKHTIPVNILSNSVQYRITVQTFDVNSNASVLSDSTLFYCYAVPTIAIPTIENEQVNNQTVIFTGTCIGANIDTMQSYRFLLYDENKILIESYDEIYSTDYTQEVAGLENNIIKYIELIIIGVHGTEYSSGLIKFTPVYIVPKLNSTLTATNDESHASVNLEALVVEILGNVISGSISFNDNDWIDLKTNNGKISFQQGFNISKDFALKLYLKNLEDNVEFLKLVSPQGYITFEKNDTRIHAFKYINNSTLKPSHFASSIITDMTNTSNMVIFIKYVSDLVGIEVSLLQ